MVIVGNMCIVLVMGLSVLLFGMVYLLDLGWCWYVVFNFVLFGFGCVWLCFKFGLLWLVVMVYGINNVFVVVSWFVVVYLLG